MSKENENIKLVPELRFPEFMKLPEWREDILLKFTNVALSNGVFNDPKKVGTGYKLINVSDMYIDTTINEEKLNLLELSESQFSKNKVENGDIFFTRSSLVKSGIAYSNIYLGNSIDVTFDGHLIRFRPDKSVLFPIFANYLLRTTKVRKQLVARGKTATMTTIGQSDVSSVKLSVPTLPEQQKIAATLTSLDNLIASENEKLEALQAHKKGLLQQLFPAKGETVPKVRFGEFRGEWEEKRISRACEKPFSGSTPKSTNENYYGGEIPFIRSAEIDKDKTELFLTQLGYDNSSAKMVKKGDVLIALYGANSGDVAISNTRTLLNEVRLSGRRD